MCSIKNDFFIVANKWELLHENNLLSYFKSEITDSLSVNEPP